MYLYMTSINRAVLFPEVHESCGVGETGATCYTKIILAYNVPNMHAMVIKLCHWVAYYVSNNGHLIVTPYSLQVDRKKQKDCICRL